MEVLGLLLNERTVLRDDAVLDVGDQLLLISELETSHKEGGLDGRGGGVLDAETSRHETGGENAEVGVDVELVGGADGEDELLEGINAHEVGEALVEPRDLI